MADTGTPPEGQEPVVNSDAVNTDDDANNPPQGGGEDAQGANDANATTGDGKADPWAGIPEDHWTRKEIETLRKESASKRTENKNLREQLEGAKTPEEVQQIVDDYSEKLAKSDRELAKVRAGRAHELPDDLVELLRGETEDELLAHAEKLSKFAPKNATPRTPPPLTPGGGRDPRAGSDEETSDDAYAKVKARNARRF